MLVISIVFVLISGFYLFNYTRKKRDSFPPGPISWPILGNFLQVGTEPHKSVMAMRKKYGNIIGIDLGPKRAVFINDYELIKEAFNMIPFSGRPLYPHYSINGNTRGIVVTSGKTWMEQRRFAFSYIQSGFRNGVPIETLILKEANELTDHFRELANNRKPISTVHIFNIPILNVLWGIAAGERYELTDPKILKIMHHVHLFSADAAIQGIFVLFYKWAKMFPKISGLQNFMDNFNQIINYIRDIVGAHKKTYVEGIQRDLIDCYLAKINSTSDEASSFFGKTGEENLLAGVLDIFLTGAETSSTTLRWILFLMAYHPKIQEKLNTIICKHMLDRKQPLLKDRQLLPFVEAVILEVLRFSSMVPIGVLHEATEDVQFHGYLIPKDTMVIANLFGVLHDTAVWGDPENFRPQRFLNEDETEVIRNPALIPFSTGKRACPGESLARDELFLFTMKIFQTVKVSFDPDEPIPSIKHVNGFTLTPAEHKIIFSVR